MNDAKQKTKIEFDTFAALWYKWGYGTPRQSRNR